MPRAVRRIAALLLPGGSMITGRFEFPDTTQSNQRKGLQHRRVLSSIQPASPLNESSPSQLYLDLRTGQPTGIVPGADPAEQRAACTALNRRRTRGILEVTKQSPPGEQVSIDVWTTAVGRGAEEWEVPLIALSNFGIEHDEDGFREAEKLYPMLSGAEACPYYDEEERVVYKLFDLRTNGSLGKKLCFLTDEAGDYYVETGDAVLKDTIEKLAILNAVGGHPTEIMGLSDDGHYLIAKQPLAFPYEKGTFAEAQELALEALKCARPPGCRLRANGLGVVWCNDQPWIAGDFHERNVMMDYFDNPTIIDALLGSIPPRALIRDPWLQMAANQAKEWHNTGYKPIQKNFDDVPDSLL
jgi:hypothetical protein